MSPINESQKRQEVEYYGRLLYKAVAQRVPKISFSVEDLQKKMESLLRGLPAEDEFIMLVNWLGKCKLIHKLEQEQFPKTSLDIYQVPDFFAVFEFHGRDIPVLIEVKKTKKDKIKWSAKYVDKIKRYAALLNLPLLIAWKFSPENSNDFDYWTLFDIHAFTKPVTGYKITMPIASRESLLGFLAGDFVIVVKSGVGIHFHADLIGGEKDWQRMRETNRFFGAMRLFWTDGNGNKIDPYQLSSGLRAILNCVPPLSEASFQDAGASQTQSFTFLENHPLFAQHILPILLTMPLLTPAVSTIENDEFMWRNILNQNELLISSEQIYEVADGKGAIVDSIIHTIPHTIPDFLR
jgi:Holliday junction resolvase